jgi:hypothetical protein
MVVEPPALAAFVIARALGGVPHHVPALELLGVL